MNLNNLILKQYNTRQVRNIIWKAVKKKLTKSKPGKQDDLFPETIPTTPEATKAAKPVKAPSGQKGMYLPRKGETPSRKRGGTVKRKAGGKIKQGNKAGGKG